MKYKLVFLFVIFTIYTYNVAGQESHLPFIGLESGATGIFSEVTNHTDIRGDTPSYQYSSSTNGSATSLSSTMDKWFVGIKSGVYSSNKKFSVSGGIRYSQLNSTVGQDANNSGNYFYFLLREDGINTEYLRIQKINQKSDYIGIPIEIKFIPKKPGLFRVFFKVGAEFNFLVHTQSDVVFRNAAMDIYQHDVSSRTSKLNTFSSSIYAKLILTFGCKKDNDQTPVKTTFTNNELSFVLVGQVGSSTYLSATPIMKMTFKISGYKPSVYSELIALNGITINLKDPVNHVLISIDSKENTVVILNGTLTFKRVQNLIVDKSAVEVIFSGEFNFQALINGEATGISDGRFDLGIGPDNFFSY